MDDRPLRYSLVYFHGLEIDLGKREHMVFMNETGRRQAKSNDGRTERITVSADSIKMYQL